MPIYGFECTACGHRFDRLQKLSDPDPSVCPACAAESLRRQMSAPSFRLAGSGWYETDFKKDGDRKRNLAEGAEASKTDSSADSKSEAKADGTSDSKGESKPAAAGEGKAAPAAVPAPAAGGAAT